MSNTKEKEEASVFEKFQVVREYKAGILTGQNQVQIIWCIL